MACPRSFRANGVPAVAAFLKLQIAVPLLAYRSISYFATTLSDVRLVKVITLLQRTQQLIPESTHGNRSHHDGAFRVALATPSHSQPSLTACYQRSGSRCTNGSKPLRIAELLDGVAANGRTIVTFSWHMAKTDHEISQLHLVTPCWIPFRVCSGRRESFVRTL